MARARAGSKREPRLSEMPSQRMAVVTTMGDPNEVGQEALQALFGSVYTLKFQQKKQGADFKVGPLRARWPNAHLAPKDEWIDLWGMPVPDDVTTLPRKEPSREVRLERWEYGTVAEALHVGPYAEEGPTIERLHRFIEEQGYEVAGMHEEEYLTTPRAKVQRTIIRYPVRRKG